MLDLIEVYKIIKSDGFCEHNPFILSKNRRHPFRLIRNPNIYHNENWFFNRTEKTWNSICSNMSNIQSIDQFKKMLMSLESIGPSPHF